MDTMLPPGTYELEISDPEGTLGWWSDVSDVFAQGRAMADGAEVAGDRTLRIRLHDVATEKSATSSPSANHSQTTSRARLVPSNGAGSKCIPNMPSTRHRVFLRRLRLESPKTRRMAS